MIDPHHIEALRTQSGINLENLQTSGVFSADAEQSKKLVGVRQSGIAFPYFDLTRQVLGHRIRFDEPLQDGARYCQPESTPLNLFFHPDDTAKLLDAKIPLYITEGEKKSLALRQAVPDGVAISPPGCKGWSHNKSLGKIWQDIPFSGRTVYFLPDSDFFTNPDVYDGAEGLIRHLVQAGAEVQLVSLQHEKKKTEKLGADDFLLTYGQEALRNRCSDPIWKFRNVSPDDLPRPLGMSLEGVFRQIVLAQPSSQDLLISALHAQNRVSKTALRKELSRESAKWKALRPQPKLATNALFWNRATETPHSVLTRLGSIVSSMEPFFVDADAHQLLCIEGSKTIRFSNGNAFATFIYPKIHFSSGRMNAKGDLICEYGAIPNTAGAAFLQDVEAFTKLKKIRQHTTAPTLVGDTVIYKPGYYENELVLYSGPEIIPSFDLSYTLAALDYPFADETSRVNALGALLGAVFCRGDFPGAHPMYLIQGDHVDLGKSQLAESFSIIATGRNPGSATFKSNDEALEKELGAHCLTNDFLCFDNIKSSGVISSPTLERSLTSTVLQYRQLGTNELITRRNDMILMATINEGRFAKDIVTRSILIFLSAKNQRRHESVKWLAEQNREKILGELLGMVIKWQEDGCPRKPVHFPKFPKWAATVNGILESNSIKGFLSNHDEASSKLDAITAALIDTVQDELESTEQKKTPARSPKEWRERVEVSGGSSLFKEIPSNRGKDSKVGAYLKRMFGKEFSFFDDGTRKVLAVGTENNKKRGQNALDYWFEFVTPDNSEPSEPPRNLRFRGITEENQDDGCVSEPSEPHTLIHAIEKNKKNNFIETLSSSEVGSEVPKTLDSSELYLGTSVLEVPTVPKTITVESDDSWFTPQSGSYHYEFDGNTYPSAWWSGETLGPRISFDLETDANDHSNIILMSAFDGEKVYRILPVQLKAVTDIHLSHELVCHNSWFDVVHLLAYVGKMDQALSLLKDRQIKDTLALSMLVSLAEGDPYGNKLGTVCKRYLGIDLPKEVQWQKKKVSLSYGDFPDIREAPAAFLHYNAYDVLAPFFLWDKLEARAEALARTHNVDPSKLLSYDLLVSTGLCGGITSHYGMALDQDSVQRKSQELQSEIEETLQILRGYGYDPVAEKAKKKKAGDKGIQDILGDILTKLETEHGIQFAKSFHEGRKKLVFSEAEDKLRPFSHIEFVAAFLKYQKLTKLHATFVVPLLGRAQISSTYKPGMTTGRISSTNPNLQNIPREHGIRDLFVAGPGKKLVIADYSGAELQAAGQYCLDHYGRSKLAEMLNAGVDVHRYVASKYLKVPEDQVTSDFRRAGKVVNFGRLGGSGAATLQAVARDTYGVDLSIQEVKDLIRLWDNLFPEAKDHFRAANAALQKAWGVDRKMAYAIAMVLKGSTDEMRASEIDAAWDHIASLQAKYPKIAKFSDAISKRITSPELARACECVRVSILPKSGRVRGGCSYTEWCNNAALQGQQADITNTAWRMLLEAGLKVVNVIHDEFIVECDSVDAEAVQRHVHKIMLAAAQQFNPDMTRMDVESAITEKWEKP